VSSAREIMKNTGIFRASPPFQAREALSFFLRML
jgi:hypothetical protein